MNEINTLLIRQLNYNWGLSDSEKKELQITISEAVKKTNKNISCWKTYGEFSFFNSNHNALFLYYLRELVSSSTLKDKLYCHAKMLHSIDFYGLAKIPNHFRIEHPLGSVIGRATLGDYIHLYQQVTIGGTFCSEKTIYPIIGNNIIFYTKSTVLGDSQVGDFVVFSANSFAINENIPSYSYVFGASPNLIIKPLSLERYHQLSNFIEK